MVVAAYERVDALEVYVEDRWVGSDEHLKRLHQLDLCQLDGKSSTIKYEADGGPSLVRCRELALGSPKRP